MAVFEISYSIFGVGYLEVEAGCAEEAERIFYTSNHHDITCEENCDFGDTLKIDNMIVKLPTSQHSSLV